MKITNVFPIPIIQDAIDPAIIEDTLQKVNKFVAESNFLNPPAPGELLTTFYDNKNFLGNIGAHDLLHLINRKTREFFSLLGFDPKCYVEITSWLQYNQPGSDFNRHDHYGAITSGVIYLQTPENCGNIVFHNPMEARRCTHTFFQRIKDVENDYNFNHITITPQAGDMIMFESWLQHTVKQNKSDEVRIAVAFNIWADKEDGQC